MNWEKSRGAIVFTIRNGRILYVIVQEMEGAYSFPKGHAEGDETEEETAHREVFEEIALNPPFIRGFRERDEYDLAEKPGTRKEVVYFLAEIGEEEPVPRTGEIRRILLLPCEEALRLFEHERTRQILTAADRFIRERTAVKPV